VSHFGRTAFTVATFCRRHEVLLQLAADCHEVLNDKGEFQLTALHVAALQNDVRAAELLLEKGIPVNARRPKGIPLFVQSEATNDAVEEVVPGSPSTRCAAWSLVYGEPPTGACDTALMIAAADGNADVAKLLVERGADIGLKTTKGLSAADLAHHNGHESLAAFLRSSPPRHTKRPEQRPMEDVDCP